MGVAESSPRFADSVPVSRRDALIEAVLDCVAEGGPQAATVRAIAARAGATPGLIRHHFASKEALVAAAFGALMARMLDASVARLPPPETTPARLRLAAFLRAALRPPAMSGRNLLLWAAFLQMTRADERMRAAHHDGYLTFRNRLAGLISAALHEEGRPVTAETVRRHAIACSAVIDGLWLQASVLPAADRAEIGETGCAAVTAILDLDLSDNRAA